MIRPLPTLLDLLQLEVTRRVEYPTDGPLDLTCVGPECSTANGAEVTYMIETALQIPTAGPTTGAMVLILLCTLLATISFVLMGRKAAQDGSTGGNNR